MSPNFSYSDLLPIGEDTTKYRLISREGVSVVKLGDKEFLQVEPAALTLLTETAIHDISHYLRSEHLEQLAKILKDPEIHDMLDPASWVHSRGLELMVDTYLLYLGQRADEDEPEVE